MGKKKKKKVHHVCKKWIFNAWSLTFGAINAVTVEKVDKKPKVKRKLNKRA